jgi:hypothetical protein
MVSPLLRFDVLTKFRQGERYVETNPGQTSQKMSHRGVFETITIRQHNMGISTTEPTRVSLIITILPMFLHPAGGNLHPLRQLRTPMSGSNADAAGMKSASINLNKMSRSMSRTRTSQQVHNTIWSV